MHKYLTRLGEVRTKAMADLIARDTRIIGISDEPDGFWLYTNSAEWCDDSGSGSFRGDNERDAIKRFRERIRRGNGDVNYPQPARD